MVATVLKLVRDCLNSCLVSHVAHVLNTQVDECRAGSAQREQRENPNVRGYAAHFPNCRTMKRLAQLARVEKEEV